MEKVTVGLINGRHPMPVDSYIFEEIQDVHDYKGMMDRIVDFLKETVGIQVRTDCAINQCDYTDVEVYKGIKELVVYVTGLTCAVAELIRACALNGVRLTLMNYDTPTGVYLTQRIFY